MSSQTPAARRVPALLITAPASGHGKTTTVAALARRLTREGLVVRVFKTGPDFLDPAWHTLASGHPVHNLDLWMTGEDDIRQRLYDAAADADLIIVEGVMGLYDGEPSAAELAVRFDLPVLAVIDASSMTGTFGALAHGLQTWMPGLRWAGAIANRVASPRHAHLIASASQRPVPASANRTRENPGVPSGPVDLVRSAGNDDEPGKRSCMRPDGDIQGGSRNTQYPPADSCMCPDGDAQGDVSHYLGHIRRDASFGLPSRHLGLVAASELADAMARLDAAADALDDTLLGQLDREALKRWNTVFHAPASPASADDGERQPPQPLAGRTIAIARDSAFAFIYPANLDTLQALGATLCFFSPLADDPLPPCDAVWLPGGYPELYAETLSACRHLPQSLRAHVEAGKPVWAECGGMLPLFERMHREDHDWPMWGILPGHIEFQKRLAGLGMQQLDDWPAVQHAVPAGDATVVVPDAEVSPSAPPLRGHTFHYSRCITTIEEVARSHRPDQPVSAEQGEAVYRYRALHASYFHAWFAGSPLRTAALFQGASHAC